MKRILAICCAAVLWLGAAGSESHAAYQFTLGNPDGGQWIPGAGYGTDSNENGSNAQHLNVVFGIDGSLGGASSPAPLMNINDSWTFTFGTITFNETDDGNGANSGINGNEFGLNNLSVQAILKFVSPITGDSSITLTATPTQGTINAETAGIVDFELSFGSVEVQFGNLNSGKFLVELGNLNGNGGLDPFKFSFTGDQKTATARITLTQIPTNQGGPVVPEPTSLALAGFAGIGMAVGAIRRRRQSKVEAA